MSGRSRCWIEQVADEFERVSKDVAGIAAAAPARRSAAELASLAAAIREDCDCGGMPHQGRPSRCSQRPNERG